MALTTRLNLNKSLESASQRRLTLCASGDWWKEKTYLHAENLGKNYDSFVSDRGTPSFDVGEDVASHATPE